MVVLIFVVVTAGIVDFFVVVAVDVVVAVVAAR